MTEAETFTNAAAAAIANSRGMRRGVPAVTNILELLPAELRDEVTEDARAVLEAVSYPEICTALKLALELIRIWHCMGMPEGAAKVAWEIYESQAPEMEPIREVLQQIAALSGGQ